MRCVLTNYNDSRSASSVSSTSSPVPAEENEAGEMANRGLIEDLLIGMIRDLVINQINAILGITTTTTPCTGLIGGGLLCPPVK